MLIIYFDDNKEGNVLFIDALITFYIRLYGVNHIVKDHSNSERENPLPTRGLLFPIQVRSGQVRVFNVQIQSKLL